MFTVSILTNDQVSKKGLLAEHGLSLWIEKDNKNILFDVGQSSVFCHNANVMGIDLKRIDYIVLSHGHYDHCSGLPYFQKQDNMPSIYVHPEALLRKLRKVGDDKPFKEIGIEWTFENIGYPTDKINFIKKPVLINENIMVSGEIPRTTDFEEPLKGAYIERNNQLEPDFIMDEQMLIIREKEGVVIFLGCSHPGVINCLKYAKELFPQEKVLALIAGMHLLEEAADSDRLRKTIDYMVNAKVEKVIPLHCTGFIATYKMKQAFGENCLLCYAGDVIKL